MADLIIAQQDKSENPPTIPENWDYNQSIQKVQSLLAIAGRRPFQREKQLPDLYFIADLTSQAVKVGVAYSVEERLKQLQTGNPNKLAILDIFPNAGQQLEKQIHKSLKSAEISGEWFRLETVQEWLAKNKQVSYTPSWDFEGSVKRVKTLLEIWTGNTTEIACELKVARDELSKEGRPKKLGHDVPVLTWNTYCSEIGLEKRTANRWIASVFGNVRLPSPPLPKMESQVLYADPPWAFGNSGFDQSAAQQYPTLSLEDICKYSDGEKTVRQLSKEKESVLFLWVPEALVPEGLEVVKAWGFTYKAQLVWKKDRAPGMGWWINSKHELLFIGARGTELHPATKYDSVFEAPVTDHSRKPHIVYEMIESMYTGPYIELFARNTRNGWESWGNEVR